MRRLGRLERTGHIGIDRDDGEIEILASATFDEDGPMTAFEVLDGPELTPSEVVKARRIARDWYSEAEPIED